MPAQSKPPAPPPKPATRREIVKGIEGAFRFESRVLRFEDPKAPLPDVHPKVVALRRSQRDPLYAAAVVELRNSAGERLPGTTAVVMRRRTPLAQTGTEFEVGCTKATPRAVRELICPSPWAVLNYPKPDLALDRTVSAPEPVTDIHAVDWRNATLPGALCGATEPLRFRKGQARVHSADEPWWMPMEAGVGWSKRMGYGDIDGDGRDEAMVVVTCTNGGGTAGGQLRFAVAVIGADARSLRLLGTLSTRQPIGPIAVHPPLISVRSRDISIGRVAAREFWYGPNDGTAGASGSARTVWNYADGRLTPVKTTVLKPPRP